jgi:hypothetical protein
MMGFSLFHRYVQTGSGAHQVSYPIGIGTLTPGVKREGREADHLPPSSATVKNAWSYASLQYVFMAWCLVKHRDKYIIHEYEPFTKIHHWIHFLLYLLISFIGGIKFSIQSLPVANFSTVKTLTLIVDGVSEQLHAVAALSP